MHGRKFLGVGLLVLLLAGAAAAQANVFEGFEGTAGSAGPLPAGWAQLDVTGTTGNWTTETTGTFPTCSPYAGTRMAKFNSFSASTGNSTRLYYQAALNLTYGQAPATVNFYMYHDTGYTTANDRIQVQVSTNGGANWTDVGTAVPRYNGSTGWALHSIDMSAYLGQASVMVGLLGTGQYGNNMYVDSITIHVGGPAVAYASNTWSDTCPSGGPGDDDGYADPGETLSINVSLTNSGDATAAAVTATLSSPTTGVTVVDGTAVYGDITAGATVAGQTDFTVQLAEDIPCGTLIQCVVDIQATIGQWTGAFAIRVGQPQAPVTLYTQNFDGVTAPAIPADWVVVDVSGTAGEWITYTASAHPTGVSPHSAPNMAGFNSWTASSGNSTRLYYGTALDLSTYPTAAVSYWLYHDTVYINADTIQVQVSTNGGTNWANVGLPVPRYTGAAGWAQHTIDLSAFGMQPSVMIGLLATSAYGNDMYADDVMVTGTPYACNPCIACTVSGCTATATPDSGAAPLDVAFAGTVDYTGCAGTPTWAWDFGDGNTSTEQNPTHTYLYGGSYNYSLTVTVDGETCTAGGTVSVCEVSCDASASPTSGLAPLDVNFTCNVGLSNCLDPVEFLWDFGDGETSTDQFPTHTYYSGGLYNWTLTVTVGAAECTATGTIEVDAYDLSFYDDVGRGRLCVNSVTGAFAWSILAGPYKGWWVVGTAFVSEAPGLVTISSPPWMTSWQMLFRYYPQQHRAAGTLYLRGWQMTSAISDRETTNNPGGCDFFF